MPGADNIGTLSVDVVAKIGNFDTQLDKVEERLGKIPGEVPIKLSLSGVSEAQLKRLQTAVELIERIQKTGVTNIGAALSGQAATKGGGGAASGKAQNVNVAIKEADLTATFRKAAIAAFAQPIPGVKLDLDIEYLQRQLSGLNVSFSGANNTQASPAPQHAADMHVAGLRESIQPKQAAAIADLVTAVNKGFQSRGVSTRLGGQSPDQMLMSIVRTFGDSVQKIAHFDFNKPSGPYGTPIESGALHTFMRDLPEDIQDVVEEAARTFAKQMGVSPAMSLIRSAGVQTTGVPAATGHAQGQGTAGQAQQAGAAHAAAASPLPV